MASSSPFQQFDVYWVDLNPTKGSEMQKIRPCVIVSPNEMNESLNTLIVVPLTSTVVDWPFRLTITLDGRKSSLACDHIRSVSKHRFLKKSGTLKQSEQVKLKALLAEIFT